MRAFVVSLYLQSVLFLVLFLFFQEKTMQKLSYESTVLSCFVAYIVQAIVINFVPLLFVTFQNDFGISLGEVTLLITFNFLIQLGVDFLSACFVDRVGYRISLIAAHLFSAAGLLLLSELPFIMDNAYAALMISVAVYPYKSGCRNMSYEE